MEVKPNVNFANFLQIGNQTGQSKVKSTDKNTSNDFLSCLQDVNQSKAENNVKDVRDSKQSKESNDTTKLHDAKHQQKTTSTKDKSSEEKDIAVENEVKDEKEVNEKVDSESNDQNDVAFLDEISVDEYEQLDEIISNLLQSLMSQFQLSVDELSDKLKEFGMEVSDLLNLDGLKAFFLNMNMAEQSDLLVDESLNSNFSSFIQEFGEFVEELESIEISIPNEEIEVVLSNISQEDFPEEMQLEKPQMIEEQPDELKNNEPEVIVDNHSEKNQTENNQSETNPEFKKESGDNETNLKTEYSKRDYDYSNHEFENPILQAIDEAINQVEDVVSNNQPVKGADVIQQIVEQIKVQVNQNTTSMEMQLYPEHLGKIQINVVSKDGVMTARIVAENEAARQAIESGLNNLKETMEQQGLKVEAIEVMVSTTGFEQNEDNTGSASENQTSKGRKKMNILEADEEQIQEDAAEVEKMKVIGSSVSYSA